MFYLGAKSFPFPATNGCCPAMGTTAGEGAGWGAEPPRRISWGNNAAGVLDPKRISWGNDAAGIPDPKRTSCGEDAAGMLDPTRTSWSNDAAGMLDPKIISSGNNAVGMLDPRRISWGNDAAGIWISGACKDKHPWSVQLCPGQQGLHCWAQPWGLHAWLPAAVGRERSSSSS